MYVCLSKSLERIRFIVISAARSFYHINYILARAVAEFNQGRYVKSCQWLTAAVFFHGLDAAFSYSPSQY
jgi:hypothetical protein